MFHVFFEGVLVVIVGVEAGDAASIPAISALDFVDHGIVDGLDELLRGFRQETVCFLCKVSQVHHVGISVAAVIASVIFRFFGVSAVGGEKSLGLLRRITESLSAVGLIGFSEGWDL